MTISTTVQRVDCPGNGSATVFSFAPMPIFEASDLLVIKRDGAGNETTISPGTGTSNYVLSSFTFPGTGSITYPAVLGTKLQTGETLVIKRVLPLLQSTDLQNQGAYLPAVQEAVYDYLTAVDQQQEEEISRVVKVAATDTGNLTLPTATARANQLLGFDSAGNAVAAQPSNALVSTAMAPIVDAASTASALALLGTGPTSAAMLPVTDAATIPAARLALGAASRQWTGTTQKTLGDAIEKGVGGAPLLVHCYGDSLTEGYQSGGSGGILNSGLTLATTTYPQALAAAMTYSFANLSVVTVQNFGYSGDTTKQGYDRWAPVTGGSGVQAGRWALQQSAVPDIAFVMFGYNDANGYGGTTATVAECRQYTALWIERLLNQGTAPILLLMGPIRSTADNQKFEPYRDAQLQVAKEYGVPCLDMGEQVGWKYDRWTDGVHMTAQGYNELGWHLAAVFNGFAGQTAQHVSAGTIIRPEDWPQSTAGTGAGLFAFASARTGYLLQITAAKTANLGVYCEEDVFPVITTYNAGGTVRDIDIYYAGNGSGVSIIAIKSPGTGGVRKRVVGPMMHRGYRTLGFLCGANTGFIESVEFVSARSAIGTPQAGDQKSSLGGMASRSQEAGDWCAIDYSRLLTPTFAVEFRGTIPANGITGIAFMFDQDQTTKAGAATQYMVLRSGDDLILRVRSAGVDTDTTATNFFVASTGVDYVGPLVITNSGGGTLDIRRTGGSGGALGSAISTSPVYPALIVLGGSTTGIQCASFVTRD